MFPYAICFFSLLFILVAVDAVFMTYLLVVVANLEDSLEIEEYNNL